MSHLHSLPKPKLRVPRLAISFQPIAFRPHEEHAMGPEKVILLNGFEWSRYGPDWCLAIEFAWELSHAIATWLVSETEHRVLNERERRMLRCELASEPVDKNPWYVVDVIEE